jgi:hypothetical protein
LAFFSFFSLFSSSSVLYRMIRSLKVNKVNHPVSLSFDEEGLRIEGDFNAAKNCKKKKV